MATLTTAISTKQVYPGAPIETGASGLITTSKSAIVKTSQHAQKKRHPHIWLPPTPFNASVDRLMRDFVVFASSPGDKGYNGITYGPALRTPDASLVAKLQNMAVIDSLNKLKAQKVNFSQAYAERRQTARLVHSSAERIALAIRDLRKGKYGDAASRLGVPVSKKHRSRKVHPQELGDAWLELQYGWKPLLGDVYGSMVALHENDKDAPDRYRITVRSTKTSRLNRQVNEATAGIGFVGFEKLETSVRVRLDYQIENPAFAAAAGLGLLNPLELAWELLPWSFVADWFIPVGDYLSTMDATVGLVWKGGCSTSRFLQISEGRMKRAGYNSTLQYPYWFGKSCHRNYKAINRTIYSSSPFPRFPGFKNPLTATHALNAIALLRGSVR